MRTNLIAPLRRLVSDRPRGFVDVHFHTGSDGAPVVCDLDRCDSPRVSPYEVYLGR